VKKAYGFLPVAERCKGIPVQPQAGQKAKGHKRPAGRQPFDVADYK